MATEVLMPQMGESIAEGTIVRWIKQVGDSVARDEPLFEISTDKVDAEIPAPAAGVLTEIRAKAGETVPVNTVVAVIGGAGSGVEATAPPVPETDQASNGASVEPPQAAVSAARAEPPVADVIRQRSSPLVRRIADEHGVDIAQVSGTGMGGRVTKDDILKFIARTGSREPGPPVKADSATPAPPGPSLSTAVGVAGQTVPMSHMRKKIAEHMVLSRRTSAHVHSVFEVDFSKVEQAREARKGEFERGGTRLTYLSFIMKAAIDALRAVPAVNASVQGDTVVFHAQVNIGIAVALDWGLIVPVVKQADRKSLLDLSRAIADLAGRARTKQLTPDEVTGGTFTITNPGSFGALFGMPIINQPQVAILGVGAVEKRPVVVNDAIAIRPMAYLCLGYDHRLIDGAVADGFMSIVKHGLEHWRPEQD